MQSKRHRLIIAVVVPLAALIGAVVWLPVPHTTICEGVAWAPEESRLYAAADGFVRRVLVPSGTEVAAGTPLIQCEDPELKTRVAILESRLEEFEARYRLHRYDDLAQAEIFKEEIVRAAAELARAREHDDDLLVHSRSAGIFLLPRETDWLGRFVRRGVPIGYILDKDRMLIRVLVPQADIERVQTNTRRVDVRMAEDIHAPLAGRIVRQVPAATRELPSPALSLEGGGRFAIDPEANGKLQVFERLFQLDIMLDAPMADKVGSRAFVRFRHDPEPLLHRWYSGIRRLLLRRFDV